MKTVLAAFGTAAAVNLAVTPLVRRFAIKVGAVSVPGGRHVHREPIPRLGGIGLCVAFIAPLLALFFVASSVADVFRAEQTRAIGLMVGAIVMCLVGVVDDTHGLRATTKLLAQVGVGLLAYYCGFRIDAVYLPIVGNISMGIFALPITIIWTVGIINAVNLIDGLDGLAAGVVFFAALTNFIIAYLVASVFVALIMAALLGAVLAFLVFNFNPARIFMGDSGSYFLGYVLAVSSLICNEQRASTTVSLLVPILAMGVPIFDTLLAMLRRLLEHRSIFSADRGHIHHRLLGMGMTHRRAVLVLYSACLVLAAAAIGVSIGRSWEVGVALLIASLVFFGLVRFVGYFEYFSNLRVRGARVRTPQTERVRGQIRHVLSQLGAAPREGDLLDGLVAFVEACEFASTTIGPLGGPPSFEWKRPGLREDAPRISVTFRMGAEGVAAMQVTYSWQAEHESVSPELDIMLQIVTDAMVARLVELRSRLVTEISPVAARHGLSNLPVDHLPTSETSA